MRKNLSYIAGIFACSLLLFLAYYEIPHLVIKEKTFPIADASEIKKIVEKPYKNNDSNWTGELRIHPITRDFNKPFNALTLDLNRFCQEFGYKYGKETSKDYNDLLIHYDCFEKGDKNE